MNSTATPIKITKPVPVFKETKQENGIGKKMKAWYIMGQAKNCGRRSQSQSFKMIPMLL